MIDWPHVGAIVKRLGASLKRAAVDIRTNRAPPASKPMTGEQVAATLEAIQGRLPGLIAATRAHQGVITGAEDILTAAQRAGVSWAGAANEIVASIPADEAEAQEWIPKVLFFLSEFAPAAQMGDNARPTGIV